MLQVARDRPQPRDLAPRQPGGEHQPVHLPGVRGARVRGAEGFEEALLGRVRPPGRGDPATGDPQSELVDVHGLAAEIDHEGTLVDHFDAQGAEVWQDVRQGCGSRDEHLQANVRRVIVLGEPRGVAQIVRALEGVHLPQVGHSLRGGVRGLIRLAELDPALLAPQVRCGFVEVVVPAAGGLGDLGLDRPHQLCCRHRFVVPAAQHEVQPSQHRFGDRGLIGE